MRFQAVFKAIGLPIQTFAELLLVPERTVYSWLRRGGIIPRGYDRYFSALEQYLMERKTADLEEIGRTWLTEDAKMLEEQKQKALREIGFKKRIAINQLEKLKAKANEALSLGHLSEQYSKYLEHVVANKENTNIWLARIKGKSKFIYPEIIIRIRKYEQVIVGLESQESYWNKA